MNARFVVRFVTWFGHSVRHEFVEFRSAQSFARRMEACGCSNVTVRLEEEFHSMTVSWR